MRLSHTTTQFPSNVLRIATYNIHKGVRGVGPRKRLEIHNLVLGIEALDADFVFLQEVRRMNRAEARQFPDTRFGWPRVPQADYLAPDGYEVAYRTNATTRDGEHGNEQTRRQVTNLHFASRSSRKPPWLPDWFRPPTTGERLA